VKPYRCMGGGSEPVWDRVARTEGAGGARAVGSTIGGSGPVVRPAAAVKPELEADACCSGGRSAESRRCRCRCRLVQEPKARVQPEGGPWGSW
jgi:hypothetical protein